MRNAPIPDNQIRGFLALSLMAICRIERVEAEKPKYSIEKQVISHDEKRKRACRT